MKSMIELNMGRTLKNVQVEFVNIGETESNTKAGKTVDGMIAEFNEKHMSKSPHKLALDGGYPTIFRHCDNKLEYYKGERNADELYKWFTSKCTTINDTNTNNNTKNSKGGASNKKNKTNNKKRMTNNRSNLGRTGSYRIFNKTKNNRTRRNRGWFFL